MPTLNEKAPDFCLQGDNGKEYCLSDQAGERVLLVFYPGDNTPVCTAQLCEYRDGIESFAGLGVSVVGISSDNLESHQAFRNKHDLPFVLLSDPDGSVNFPVLKLPILVQVLCGSWILRMNELERQA